MSCKGTKKVLRMCDVIKRLFDLERHEFCVLMCGVMRCNEVERKKSHTFDMDVRVVEKGR
jgi:hypothetical protein